MVKQTALAAIGAICCLLPATGLLGLAMFLGPTPPDSCENPGQQGVSATGCDTTDGDAGALPAAPEPFTGLPGGMVVDPSGTGGWVTRPTAHLYAQTRVAFPASGWSCWDAHEWNPTSDHPQGRACDITFGNTPGIMPTQDEAQRGWRIAHWLQTYAAELHIDYLIYAGQMWSTGDSAWEAYVSDIYDTSTPTGGHYDHIHVSVTD